jgi:hypothetical protein
MSDAPTGLPPVEQHTGQSALDRNRLCPKCGKEGRTVSNSSGLSVFCNPCKFSWPISTAPLDPKEVVTAPRGLRKKTLVEPDWDMAFDENIGGQSGPPKKR